MTGFRMPVGTLSRIATRLRGHPFARAVAVMTGGAAVGQVVAIGSTPILSRLYTPEEFGVLAVFTSLLTTSGVIACLRYDYAVLVAEDDEWAARVAQLALACTLATSLLIGAAVVVIGAAGLTVPALLPVLPYLWLLPLGILGTGLYQTFHAWAVRRRNYRSIAVTSVMQNIWMVGAQIAFAFVVRGPLGLIVGANLRAAGGSLRLASDAWQRDREFFRIYSWRTYREVAVRFRKFPLVSTPSAFLNSWGLQLPFVLVAMLFGLQAGGAFFLAHKLIAIPITFLSRGVTSAYVGEASTMLRSDPIAAKRLFQQTVRQLLLVGSVPAVLLFVLAPVAVPLVLGGSWEEAGWYLRLLALMFLAKFTIHPLTHTLMLLERQERQLAWDLGRFLVVSISLFVVGVLGHGATIGVSVYGFAMTLCYVAYYRLALRSFDACIADNPERIDMGEGKR